MSDFKGTLFGAEYDDPQAWERAVRSAGYRPGGSQGGLSRRLVGTEVQLRSTKTGEVVGGQVWALSPKRGHVWVVLDNGDQIEMHARHGDAAGWKAAAA